MTTGPTDSAGYREVMTDFATADLSYDEVRELLGQGRRTCPVPHSERLGGYHALLRYDDVRSAFENWGLFSSSPRAFRPLTGRASTPPMDFDPPGHRPWRVLLGQAFTPRSARQAEDSVRAGAHALIDAFEADGHCDLMAQYAEQLPLLAISALLGFPTEKLADVRQLTVDLFAASAVPEQALAAFERFVDFGLAEAASRRTEPRDDFITTLVDATIEGVPLTDREIGTAMVVLLGAGHETTVSALGSLLFEVLGRPEARRAVLDGEPVHEPAVTGAVDESLRLHPPFYGPYRRLTASSDDYGVPMQEGDSAYLCIGSANRDERTFDHPDDFDLERRPNRHLTFGHGIHTCPGARTARMELAVGLSVLLERLPDIVLEDADDVEFAFTGNENLSIERLPAQFEPRR